MFFDLRNIRKLPNFLDETLLASIYKKAINSEKIDATVGKIINGKYTTDYNEWCTAKFVQYFTFSKDINEVSEKILQVIRELYNVDCIGSPEIHFLCYENGTYYKSHIDGQFIENGYAKRGIDRDLTAVIYLNDDYEGGEVTFDFFKLKVKPKQNDLLIYPTTLQYKHSVSKVNGIRYAIVFWYKTNPELNVETKVPLEVLQTFNEVF